MAANVSRKAAGRIDSPRRFAYLAIHGDVAISPRGVMPKYRVPYLSRGRIHVILHNDIC
jgi:hypothetical protein